MKNISPALETTKEMILSGLCPTACTRIYPEEDEEKVISGNDINKW